MISKTELLELNVDSDLFHVDSSFFFCRAYLLVLLVFKQHSKHFYGYWQISRTTMKIDVSVSCCCLFITIIIALLLLMLS
jgi:hypothetical protein